MRFQKDIGLGLLVTEDVIARWLPSTIVGKRWQWYSFATERKPSKSKCLSVFLIKGQCRAQCGGSKQMGKSLENWSRKGAGDNAGRSREQTRDDFRLDSPKEQCYRAAFLLGTERSLFEAWAHTWARGLAIWWRRCCIWWRAVSTSAESLRMTYFSTTHSWLWDRREAELSVSHLQKESLVETGHEQKSWIKRLNFISYELQ